MPPRFAVNTADAAIAAAIASHLIYAGQKLLPLEPPALLDFAEPLMNA